MQHVHKGGKDFVQTSVVFFEQQFWHDGKDVSLQYFAYSPFDVPQHTLPGGTQDGVVENAVEIDMRPMSRIVYIASESRSDRLQV